MKQLKIKALVTIKGFTKGVEYDVSEQVAEILIKTKRAELSTKRESDMSEHFLSFLEDFKKEEAKDKDTEKKATPPKKEKTEEKVKKVKE